MFTFTLESATPSHDLNLEKGDDLITFTVFHIIPAEGYSDKATGKCIELNVPFEAFLMHIAHGDNPTHCGGGGCEPPYCG